MCRIRRSVSERVKVRGKPRESLGSPNDGSRAGGVAPPEPEEEGEGDGKGLTSEPISIKGTSSRVA